MSKIRIIKTKIEAGKSTGKLCIVSDAHVGNILHDEKTWNRNMDWLDEHKEYQVITLGDLIECATTQHKENQIMTIDDQIDYIVDRFSNIAKEGRLIGMIQGNHEFRGIRDAGIDPNHQMAKRLGVEDLGEGAIIYINVKRDTDRRGQNYTVYATHGASRSTTPAGRTNAVLRLEKVVDNADLHLMGHVHALKQEKISTFRCDRGNPRLIEKHFVICGHYLLYGGYSQRGVYPPSCPSGSPRFSLHADKHEITVKL